eukprot:symbB.v1.2.004883.t1/scaffold277.1/size415908/2
MCFAYADEKISEEDLRGTRILPPVPPPTLDRSKVIEDITLHTKNYFKHALEHAQHLVVQLYQVMKNLDEYSDDIVLKVENATGSAILWNGRVLYTTDMKVEGRKLEGRRRTSFGSLVKRSIFINEILSHLNREMECLWKYYTSIERKRAAIGNTITSSPYGPHGQHPKHWVASGSFPINRVHKNLTELLMAQDLLLADLVVGSVASSMVLENTLAKQLQVAYLSLMGNVNNAARKIRGLVVLLVKMNRCAVAFLKHPSGVWKRFDPASF